jgi:hypothetical protein
VVGSHGETLGAFLKPGFHSGTVPKTYAKLRRAAWREDKSVEKHREAIHHAEQAVSAFVTRELVTLLETAGTFAAGEVLVRSVEASGNRLRVSLARAGHDGLAVLHFEEQSGLLLASVATPGFLSALDEREHVDVSNGLAGLYAHAGVELVRERVAAALGPHLSYDVADEGLVVFREGEAWEAVYDLRARTPRIARIVRGEGSGRAAPRTLDLRRLRFDHRPLSFARWVGTWEAPAGERRLVAQAKGLLPPPRGS